MESRLQRHDPRSTPRRPFAYEEMFRGTLAQTSVYPRKVVKAALAHNAAAVIVAHNHPSGIADQVGPTNFSLRV